MSRTVVIIQEELFNGYCNDVLSNIDVVKSRNTAIEFLQVQFSKVTNPSCSRCNGRIINGEDRKKAESAHGIL
jgi:hypothetical protein